MILAARFAAWLDEPAAMACSRTAARGFATRWRAHPIVAGLHARLDAGEAVETAVAPLLDDIGWVQDAIADLTAEAARDPFFEPPLRAIEGAAHAGLRLIDHPRVSIGLTAISLTRLSALKAAAGPRAIGFSGETMLLRVIEPGGAVLAFWSADPAGPDFDPTRAPPCRFDRHVKLEAGQCLTVDGRRQSYAILRATGDILLLQVTLRGAGGPLLIEYDAQTLNFLAMGATDTAAARAQLAAALLVAMGRRDAAPVIAAQAEDPRFFVRWQAARALAALDPAAATPLLVRMAEDDPQPDVRQAAARTLALLCPA